MRPHGHARHHALIVVLALAGCATPPSQIAERAPLEEPCPAGPPPGTRCLRGVDSKGAHYLIAMPAQWNGVLVLHLHGGPPLELRRARVDEDTQRWAITVKAGYAWAASGYSVPGVAVRSAAEDTERLRRIFVQHVAKPRRTLLHGNSWGAGAAAKAGEMYAAPGMRSPYDGIVLTSGVLAGGTRSYDFRLDLRVVYQHYCRNHPAADDPPYPLWMGVPADSKLTQAELNRRVDECLGTRRPAAQRSPEQAKRLKAIASVIRIPESSVASHLNWATWHFRDVVQRLGGRNPFGNEGVRYSGSDDDAALNAAVARYRRDPQATAALADDADPSGRIGIPVLTVHSIGDPTAAVEMEHFFARAMERAGAAGRLVQTFTDDREHSYIAHPVYPTLFAAMLRWVDAGEKPTPEGIAAECRTLEKAFGPGCRFDPAYRAQPLESRVPPR